MTFPRREEALRLVHHHPGRLRARASVFVDAGEDHPAVEGARAAAASAKVLRFSHSPITGSILIEYAPGGVDPDALLERIAVTAGLVGVVHDGSDKTHRDALVEALLDVFASLNEIALEATRGRADLRELVPGALVLTSLAGLASGGGGTGFMPRWEVMLWFSQTFFAQWHGEEIARRTAKTGVKTQ
ncbi:MAG: HMA2 domain-containing protein [Polyangiales bacterium]